MELKILDLNIRKVYCAQPLNLKPLRPPSTHDTLQWIATAVDLVFGSNAEHRALSVELSLDGLDTLALSTPRPQGV